MNNVFNILIVDDEPPIVDTITKLLQSHIQKPMELFTAYRGNAALSVLESNRIDLLITDINMPDMSGLDLLKTVSARWSMCKTLIFTGYPVFEYAYEAFREHAAGYILKSDSDDVFLAQVYNTLHALEEEMDKSLYGNYSHRSSAVSHTENLFSAAMTATEQQDIFQYALPTWGFSVPYQNLYFIQALLPHPFSVDDCQRLENTCVYYLSDLTRMALVEHNAPQSLVYLCQFRQPISQVRLNGMLEPSQSAFSSIHEQLSFLVKRIPDAAGSIPKAYQQMQTQYRKMCSMNVAFPFVYTLSDMPDKEPVRDLRKFVDDYITAHIREDISVAQISQESGYNSDYLSRIFRELTGNTLGRYLVMRRLSYIKSLMEQPSASLDVISTTTGFSSRSYFNRFIKRETGMTPQQLQAMLRHVANK